MFQLYVERIGRLAASFNEADICEWLSENDSAGDI